MEPLIAAARAGSAEALGTLYTRFGASLYRLAYRLTGSPDDAEDVVHDVSWDSPRRCAATRSAALSPGG